MYGSLLQDWLRIRAASDPLAASAPSEWLELREITTNITVPCEASPRATREVLVEQNPTIPLAPSVRWRVADTGTPAGAWDMTFRLTAAANAVGALG